MKSPLRYLIDMTAFAAVGSVLAFMGSTWARVGWLVCMLGAFIEYGGYCRAIGVKDGARRMMRTFGYECDCDACREARGE